MGRSYTIKLTHDQYGVPLTYVTPIAFRGLKGESKHNEFAYRLIENHTFAPMLFVVLHWR